LRVTGTSDDGEALRMAFEQEYARIAAMTDPVAAFAAATRLGNDNQQFGSRIANLRGSIAERIMTDEDLSLARLADRLGVSKGLAQKIIQGARRNPRPRRQSSR
jgi:hypothetical protein